MVVATSSSREALDEVVRGREASPKASADAQPYALDEVVRGRPAALSSDGAGLPRTCGGEEDSGEFTHAISLIGAHQEGQLLAYNVGHDFRAPGGIGFRVQVFFSRERWGRDFGAPVGGA